MCGARIGGRRDPPQVPRLSRHWPAQPSAVAGWRSARVVGREYGSLRVQGVQGDRDHLGEDAMTSRICGECGQLTAFYDTCSCVRQQLANAEARVRELETREQPRRVVLVGVLGRAH